MARYSEIDPGDDGVFTVAQTSGESDDTSFHDINSVKLERLARNLHEWPAANASSTAIAARNAKAPICSMSIQLHRRFTVSNPTDSTPHVLAATTHAISGL